MKYASSCAGRGQWRAIASLALALGLCAAMPAQSAGLGDMLGSMAGRNVGGYSDPGALDDSIARLAAQLNSKTPEDISSEVRLDSVSAKKAELTYHYTLVRRSVDEVTSDVFNTRIASTVKERLCRDPQSLRLLKSGARIGYEYRDRQGAEIGKLSFAQRDCSEPG
jgi:hypothetical protein